MRGARGYSAIGGGTKFKLDVGDFMAETTEARGMMVGMDFSPHLQQYLATATTDGWLVVWKASREAGEARVVG